MWCIRRNVLCSPEAGASASVSGSNHFAEEHAAIPREFSIPKVRGSHFATNIFRKLLAMDPMIVTYCHVYGSFLFCLRLTGVLVCRFSLIS